MDQWLGVVGALGDGGVLSDGGAPAGELPIQQADHNATLTASNTESMSWIAPAPSVAASAGTTLAFSFNAPLGATPQAQCGRVVFVDLHVGGSSMDQPSMPVPMECSTADLSPQEKAMEFMLFDLSACVVPDNEAPPPVQIVPL
jgi:hypothetical protein